MQKEKLINFQETKKRNLKSKDPILNNVATVIDLQLLGQAGMDFAGNDGKTLVHRNLGQNQLLKGDITIPKGGTVPTKAFNSAKDNINVAD